MKTFYLTLTLTWALALPAWSADRALEGHRYQIRVAESLDYVEVTGHLRKPLDTVRARNGDAKRLDDLQTCDGTPLQSRGSRIYLSAGQQCFRYRHPLRNDAG